MSNDDVGSARGVWLTFRVALFVAGASLVVYVAYRYLAGAHPGDVGSLYGTIFPASLLLAFAGMHLAVKPTACSCAGRRGIKLAAASGITVFAGTWMATGLMCVSYLANTTMTTPLRGIMETFHMGAQHVFLSLGVVFVAWAPHEIAGMMGAPTADEALADAGESTSALSESP